MEPKQSAIPGRGGEPSDNAAPVVVGVDGTSAALRAARWAGAVADHLAAPLHIVTAEPYQRYDYSDAAAAVRAAELDEHREAAGAILKSAAEAVRCDHPGLVVTTSSVSEPADEALAAAGSHARLVVLGSDDVTATGALLIGSATLATVAHATCPIVAWRGESTMPTTQPVVVGVDGSTSDGGALGTAFELAARLGAPLRAIHSWTRSAPGANLAVPYLFDWNSLEENQWRHLDELIEPWRGRYPRVNVTRICVPGKPSRALVEHAADAQLVVVGSRRRNALTRGLFGSTSLNLLHHSRIPVVLCPIVEHE